MIAPPETPARRFSLRGIWRDALLVLLGALPCIAMLVLVWTCVKTRETPHRVLQTMIGNEQILRTATDLTEHLQRERSLATLAAVPSKSEARLADVSRQTVATDDAVTAFVQALSADTVDHNRISDALACLGRLKQIRSEARTASAGQWREAYSGYCDVVDAVLGVCQATRVAKTDRGIGKVFVKMVLIQNAREAASRLQTLVKVHRAGGDPFSSRDVLEIARLWAVTSEFLNAALSGLDAKSEQLLADIRRSAEWRNLYALATAIIAHPADSNGRASVDSSIGGDAVAQGILAIERTEGDILYEQVSEHTKSDRAQFVWIYVCAGFALLCQIVIAVMSGYTIVMRRRLAQSNAMLSEQQADLDTTVRSIGDAVIATDVDGHVVRMNPTAETLTGWPLAEAVGMPLDLVFQAIHAKTREAIIHPVRDVLEKGRAVAMAYDAIVVARDGTQRPIANNAAPIKDGQGRVRGAVLVFRDMTAEFQVQEQLRESEALHRGLTENLPAGVVIINPVTRVIESVNPYAAALFGTPQDKIVGRRCHAFLCPAQENGCPICDLNQTVDNSEKVMLRVNGSRVPILKSVKRIQIKGEDRLLECFVNISAHKRTEEDLRRAKQALEQHIVALRFANQALETSSHAVESGAQMRGELLMNVSHEIFTTMTSILGFAERLLVEAGLEKAPVKRVESLKTIARNSRRLLGIIDNVIDLSKLEARKLEVESVACSPASILAEVVALMRGRAAAKGLSLKLDYDGPLPESIYTDPRRFRQILVNLVGNAVQFTEAGEIRIIARLQGRAGGRPKLACTVVDTGVGISPERMAKLFEPLHRRNTSKRRKLTHPGLGLVVSKMLADLLDGDITVESEPGKGSSFTVTVATGPLGKTRMMDDPSRAEAQKLERDLPVVSAETRLDCRVLVAEDTPDIQRLIADLLTDRGVRVELVDNGELAVETALAAMHDETPFDAILMDMQMPVLDGCEAVRALRLEGYEGRIIGLTVRSMAEEREECLAAGCDDMLLKPIDPERLIALVAESASTVRAEI